MIKLSVFAILVIVVVINARCTGSEEVKFQLYYAQGEKLYNARCSNCHQHSGKGLASLYPPLAGADYMKQNFSEVVCMIRNGKRGPLTVNGVTFNQPMPGVPTMTDLELAELTTYIYNTWGNKREIADVQQISKSLQQCK